MSVVTVQVGQCGNQLGSALFNALAAEAEAAPDDFGAATRQARALRRLFAHASPDALRRRSSGRGMAWTPPARFWLTWSPRRGGGACRQSLARSPA
jgi:hypothetical protein